MDSNKLVNIWKDEKSVIKQIPEKLTEKNNNNKEEEEENSNFPVKHT